MATAIDETVSARVSAPHGFATATNASRRGERAATTSSAALTSVGAAVALAGCGGGSGDDSDGAPGGGTDVPTDVEASRLLAQASIGADRGGIARVQALGCAGWIDEQMALPPSTTRWDWLVAHGYDAAANKNSQAGFDSAAWAKILAAPDTLRQRVTLALAEIMVVSIDGLTGAGWKAFCAAHYLDLLEANAFGNYRTLMQQVSTSTAMGLYLTYRGSAKADPVSGALPDENYARELMQLFTIGLVQLDRDGTPKLAGGVPVETYGLDDITGLARVFTGWDFDLAGQAGPSATATPAFMRRPMVQIAARHESGAKTFLGTTIPPGTDGAASLALALDAIFAHPNVAPFVSRQLIQRLVTSNPSPAYVGRVGAVFDDDGDGVKGNLAAVVKALLLDPEARDPSASNGYGRLREPMLRFAAWARAFGVTSPSGLWAIGNTSDPGLRLGQSPLRSPSVFNFFRPGYVPPGSALGAAGLEAPEMQITNESTVAGYLNWMQRAIAGRVADLAPDYGALVALADDAAALLDELNVVVAAGQLGTATLATLKGALDTMLSGSDSARSNRVSAALLLVFAAPEYLVQQ